MHHAILYNGKCLAINSFISEHIITKLIKPALAAERSYEVSRVSRLPSL
jgi:hypothetical protein